MVLKGVSSLKIFPSFTPFKKTHKNFESYDFLYGNQLLEHSNKKNNKVQNCRSGNIAIIARP